MLLSPRHPLTYVAYLALTCRLFVPAGFMPGALADGGPLKLCPGGAAGALLEALAARAAEPGAIPDTHHHHHHGETIEDGGSAEQYDPWQHCPVGSVFATVGLAFELTTPVLALEHVRVVQVSPAFFSQLRAGAYRARAPPLA
jgi:hypothetical protein